MLNKFCTISQCILISFCLIFSNSVFAEDDLDTILSGVTEVNKTDTCKFDNNSYDFKLVRQPSKSLLSSISAFSCKSIFSDKLPTEYENISYDNKIFWTPFCSIKDVKTINLKGNSLESSFKSAQEQLLTKDACAAIPSKNRFSTSYKAPTQNEMGMVPLENNEFGNNIENYKNEVLRIKNISKSSCCNKNKECENLFDSLSFKYCQHQTDPNLPDTCLEKGAFFKTLANENFTTTIRKLNESKSKEKFPELISGEIMLSLFIDKKSKIANDNLNIITHELGHACSFFKAEIDAKSGKTSAIKWLDKDLNKRVKDDLKEALLENKNQNKINELEMKTKNLCTISDSDIEEYKRRMDQINLSKESINCMINNSQNAFSKRYEEGECTGGCPFAFIEEFFADAFSVTTMKEHYLNSFLFTICNGYRDPEHPAGHDNAACLLKTKEIADKLKENLNCK